VSFRNSGSAFRRCLVRASSPLLRYRHPGIVAALIAAAALASRSGHSADLGGEPSATPLAPSPPPAQPRAWEHYLQYGVGIATETVVAPGEICPDDAEAPCILGSGAGLGVRFGYRSRGAWYFGGAYQFSRHDAANLLRLPILQQVRAEARYYVTRGERFTPYVASALGGAVYGNEWRVETGGFTGYLGAGFEFEVSRQTLVGVTLGYRPLLLRSWTDGAHQLRADTPTGFGLAHLFVLELLVELRDPLPRW
jgi:hypothetical protein